MDEIKIQAEIITEETCQFTVDRPVYPDGSVFFRDASSSSGSPLAETLFSIEGVSSILIGENVVRVTQSGLKDWMPVARKIGAAIRAQLQSGLPGVSPELRVNLPSEDFLRDKIRLILQDQINPAVGQHGGYVNLIDVKKNIVYLELGGGCQGCGMAAVTLRKGVEKAIRDAVPEVGEILDITDHAAGRNPYYAPHA